MSETHAFTHWLSRDPPVLYTACWCPTVAPRLAATPLTHLWLPGRPCAPQELAAAHQELCQLLPRWRHLVAVADPACMLPGEDWLVPCHDHLFVAPEAWTIRRATEHYPAILQAAAVPWKRHWLAADIPYLLAVLYFHNGGTPVERKYLANTITRLRKAIIPDKTGRVLDQKRIAWWINQSATGLALSAAEGGCRAVAEYLLCGTPVVSTPASGGRLVLVDPAHYIECEPHPAAVAQAVQEMRERKLPRTVVRSAFLRRQRQARTQLSDILRQPLRWPVTHGLPWTDMYELSLPCPPSQS